MQINTEYFTMIMMGSKDLNVQTVSLLVTQALIAGVLNGELCDMNDAKADEEDNQSKGVM